MHRRRPIPPQLALLADLQGGVVTREQALGTGFPGSAIQRLVTGERWRRLASGIYLVNPVEPSWLTLAWAGVLIGGDHARLGGLAAAHLHGLVDAAPGDHLVLIPNSGPVPLSRASWRFRRERPDARLSRTVGSPPRITVADTVLDLAADADPAAVVHWVTTAMQVRRTSHHQIRAAMRQRRFIPHRRLLEDLLTDVAAGVRSPLELRYLRDVEQAHDLPVGQRQARRRRTEVDVLYEEWGLLVELDGRIGHVGTGRFRDLRRDNSATVDGLLTLRYGYQDVWGEQCSVAFQVAAVLAQRGWPGLPTRCASCRRVC